MQFAGGDRAPTSTSLSLGDAVACPSLISVLCRGPAALFQVRKTLLPHGILARTAERRPYHIKCGPHNPTRLRVNDTVEVCTTL